jgi:hypothetical protein
MAIKSFRFGLGTAAVPRSGLWRLWTHEDEVHLAVRTSSDPVELTAYPTGRWRIVIGSVVSRWTRPKEFRPGWTRAPDLVIPHRVTPISLTAKDPHAKESVTWLTPPAPRTLARFALLFAAPRSTEGPWLPTDVPGTENLAILPLRTLGNLHLCRMDEPVDPDEVVEQESEEFSVIVSTNQAGHPSLREAH